MNNRMKFRCWNPLLKEMMTEEYDSAMPRLYADGRLRLEYDTTDVTDDVVFMQSTGLFDRKGKLIYEDDIVDFKPERFYEGHKPKTIRICIRWHNAAWKYGWQKKCSCGKSDYWQHTVIPMKDQRMMLVIGNIYANPELLNQGGERKSEES